MTLSALSRSAFAFVLFMGAAPLVGASELKSDEEVLFFRTGTAVEAGASSWSLPVRGWVFEPETNSITRRLLLKALAKTLGLPSGSDGDKMFQARAEMFLVDSESRKDVVVKIGPGTFELPRTGSSGLTGTVFQSPPVVPAPGADPVWLRYAAVLPEGDTRRFEGEIQLAPAEGVGVISDIDDTIKVTVVLDKKEMLKNTFLRPFQAVAGMAEAYRKWAAKGAIFHYVSGSPIQLYPHLELFLEEAGFPTGGVHLRSIWDKGTSEVMDSSMEHKMISIQHVLDLHPKRTFVLVGDSGEKDPEIYAEIARKNPGRVKKIWVRKAPHADDSAARYEAAFKDLPKDLWAVFAEPSFPASP